MPCDAFPQSLQKLSRFGLVVFLESEVETVERNVEFYGFFHASHDALVAPPAFSRDCDFSLVLLLFGFQSLEASE